MRSSYMHDEKMREYLKAQQEMKEIQFSRRVLEKVSTVVGEDMAQELVIQLFKDAASIQVLESLVQCNLIDDVSELALSGIKVVKPTKIAKKLYPNARYNDDGMIILVNGTTDYGDK